jgi:hypothetical protein
MADSQHFSYEGNVHINEVRDPPPVDVKIQEVEFLNPARITVKSGNDTRSFMVSVDIINRKVYDSKGNLFLSDEVFEFLDAVNSLPEDFFEAPQEVREKAQDAAQERDRIKKDILGENNE